MFYVRHGDDQETMYNAKCQTAVLLHQLRRDLGATLPGVDLIPCGHAVCSNSLTFNPFAVPPPVQGPGAGQNAAGGSAPGTAGGTGAAAVAAGSGVATGREDAAAPAAAAAGKGGAAAIPAPLGLSMKPEAGSYANAALAHRGRYVAVEFDEDEDGIREHRLLWRPVSDRKHVDEAERLAAALDTRTADERKKHGAGKNVKAKK